MASDDLPLQPDPAAPEAPRSTLPWGSAWHHSSPRARWLAAAGVLLLCLSVPFTIAYFRCGVRGCPDVSRLGAFQPDGAPVLVDRNGERFAELRLAERTLVSLDELPEFVPEAFVAVEDRRFYDHDGVDWPRVAGAAWANVEAGALAEGSSTITMQLARNVFSERIPGQERTLWRKLLEVRVSGEIEDAYDKDEILELYLNNIFFGGGARGIEAASRQYFGKPATEVDLPQAALLAALPKAPTHYDPRRHPERARERRNLVLDLMEEQERLSPEEAAAAREAPLGVVARGRIPDPEPPPAPYFVEQVRRELEALFGDRLYREPFRVVTTLDLGVQEAFESSLFRQLGAIEASAWGRFLGTAYSKTAEISDQGTPYLQGAAVALDAVSGDVLAWVGGRDFEHSRFDRVSQARRQVGSAFKPFVFTAALAEGHPPSEVISDRPVAVDLGHGRRWEPRNFEGSYSDRVTLRQALVSSKNVATVRLAHAVGFGRVADYAERLGFGKDLPRRPSLALGTATASPLELATAYTPFATLGHRVEPRLVLRVETPEGEVLWRSDVKRYEVVDPGLAYLMTDMMRDVVDRGTGHRVRAMGFRAAAAGKTGTTNEGHDAWFVGFTPEVVATVWIGFDQPRAIQSRTSGGLLAAPVWGRAMRQVYRDRPDPPDWPRPAGVIEARVDPATGFVLAPGCDPHSGAAGTEIFLAGLTPSTVCPRWGEGYGDDEQDGLLGRMADWSGSLWERMTGEEEVAAEADSQVADGEGSIDIRPSRRDRTTPSEEVRRGFEDRDLDLDPQWDPERGLEPGDPEAPPPPEIETLRPDEPLDPEDPEMPVLPVPEEAPPIEPDPAEPSGPPYRDPSQPAETAPEEENAPPPDDDLLPDEVFEPPPAVPPEEGQAEEPPPPPPPPPPA